MVLAGHTDVVPVEGQQWSSDPFKLTQKDGKLFARGAVDMKGFLAAALSLATTLDLRALDRPLHLVLTYDEETGCFGARDISDYLRRAIPANGLCIVGEPTDMRPIVAHKGILGLRATVEGSEGHAATIANKSNAIHFASELVQYLLGQSQYYSARSSKNTYVTPYSTLQVGLINGGQARNMIARRCDLEFEFRHVPEDSSDVFLAELSAFVTSDLLPKLAENQKNASIRIETLSHVPAFVAAGNSACLRVLKEHLGPVDTGCWDGVTEAGYYLDAGLDTIVCGPGSISQAHQPNEYITMRALEAYQAFLARLSSVVAAGCM